MRDMKLFGISDDPKETELIVDAIHDERGYRKIRRALGRSYDVSQSDPMIEVVAVDLMGDRRLMLEHRVHEGRLLAAADWVCVPFFKRQTLGNRLFLAAQILTIKNGTQVATAPFRRNDFD